MLYNCVMRGKPYTKFFLLIILAVCLVYINSIKGAFVSDDIPGIVNNPTIRDVGSALETGNLIRVLDSLVYTAFGANPVPFHILSIVFHITSAILGFIFLSGFLPKKTAMLAVLIFAIHPINTEAVSWIAGRVYLIMAIFALSSLISYTKFLKGRDPKYYLTSFLIFAAGLLLTKYFQFLVVVPLIFATEFFLHEERFKFNFKKLAPYLPFVLLTAIFVFLNFGRVENRIETTAIQTPPQNYLLASTYSVYKSTTLLIFPHRLSLYRDGAIITQTRLAFMATVTIAYVLTLAYYFSRDKKIFGLLLSITLGVLYIYSPKQVSWFVAGRYLYLSSLFYSALAAMVLLWIINKKREVGYFLATTLVILLSARTIVRNADWRTEKSLWLSVVRYYPLSARAYNNLGDVFAREEDYQRSVQTFSTAIKIDPTYFEAMHNLGLTYLTVGNLDEAERYFKLSLEYKPDLYQAYYQLASIEYRRGNIEEAIDYLEKVLEIDPQNQRAKRDLILLTQSL